MSNILEVLVIVNITITQTDQQTSTLHEKRKSASQKKTMKMTKDNHNTMSTSRLVVAVKTAFFQFTCVKVCFNKIGSRAGSSVSPTSSSNTGIPIRIQFSRVRKKFWSVSLITLRPFLASFARIQRLA